MRNVFDQYSQPENRITHALATALHEDPALLRAFLKDIAGAAVKGIEPLEVHQQTYPGSLEADPVESDPERKGVPDIWITSGDDWCVLIENKVLMRASGDQLARHLVTARRLGFKDVFSLVVTVAEPLNKLPDGVRVVEWTAVYGWLLTKVKAHPWARRVTEFLEVIEGKLAEQEQLMTGTLTTFTGFPFGDERPFTYGEAKRVLGLAAAELRRRRDLKSQLGMDPDLPGRPAITGRAQDSVWDFLTLSSAQDAENFTEFPHLTFAVSRTEVQAMVTIPHGIKRKFRKRLVALGMSGFSELLREVLDAMTPSLDLCDGMEPRIRAVQRRYPSQRAIPFYDALLDFDLRTAFADQRPYKHQPQWLRAVYDCNVAKRSNFQFQVGAAFPYRRCSATQSREILDRMAETWIACKPLLDALMGED